MVIETDDGVDLVPATIELARAEAELLTRTGREHVPVDDRGAGGGRARLRLGPARLPALARVLTVAALTAADGVLVPLQCETLSHRGVGRLLDTVHDVRRFTNRGLEVWGAAHALRRAHQPRPHRARDDLRHLRPRVVEPPIPKTIKFAEAPAAGRSILATSRSSRAPRRATARWPRTW